MKHEIGALTGLRGIAALWVMAFHAHYTLATMPEVVRVPVAIVSQAGMLGVDLFFVLSGFVIAYNYAASAIQFR